MKGMQYFGFSTIDKVVKQNVTKNKEKLDPHVSRKLAEKVQLDTVKNSMTQLEKIYLKCFGVCPGNLSKFI